MKLIMENFRRFSEQMCTGGQCDNSVPSQSREEMEEYLKQLYDASSKSQEAKNALADEIKRVERDLAALQGGQVKEQAGEIGYVKEDWSKFADELAQDTGLPPASDAEREILYYGAQMGLDVQRDLIPAAQSSRMRIDQDFLIAWITGRLSYIGGPNPATAKEKYKNLFQKYKSVPTKFDSQGAQGEDYPSDGLSPINPQTYNTHLGGASTGASSSRITHDHAIRALKSITRINLTDLTPEKADQIKSIILTCIDSLQN